MVLNWIDYLILGIFVISILIGLSRGLIKEVISVGAWIVAFVVAIKFSGLLASRYHYLAANSGNESLSYLILGGSFVGLFVGTLLIGSILNYFVNRILFLTSLGLGNRLLGALFGCLRGGLFCLIIIFLMQFSNWIEKPAWAQSYLVPYFQPAVDKLRAVLQPGVEKFTLKAGQLLNQVKLTSENKLTLAP